MAGELGELLDHLGLAGELLFAAPGGLDGLLHRRAVLEVDLDPDQVAIPRPLGGDLGIVQRRHLLGHGHALRVGDHVVAELIDENVTLEQQGGDAKGQVELGRGHALGPVFPADMIDGDLGAVNDDAIHVLGAEGVAVLHHADGVERRVVGSDAGIEFEGDAHGLEPLAEPAGELR